MKGIESFRPYSVAASVSISNTWKALASLLVWIAFLSASSASFSLQVSKPISWRPKIAVCGQMPLFAHARSVKCNVYKCACSLSSKREASSGNHASLIFSSTACSPESSVNNWGQKIRSFLIQMRTKEIWRWRAAAFAFLSTLLLLRKSIDTQLVAIWSHLMTSKSIPARIFRADSYEWCLAVVAFVVWIHGFWLADRLVRKAGEHGRVHPWRKYRLQDRFEADKLRRKVQTPHAKADSSTTTSKTDQPRQPMTTKQSEWNLQAWSFELWVYALPLLTWDILAPRRHRRLAPFAAPTTLHMIGGILAGLLLYDFLFFCGHVAIHRIPFLYRTVHAKHHKVSEVRAGEIVRLSLVEEVVEVGYSILALNLLSVHPLARSVYNCVITFLLTELHSGFDFPWSPQNVIPFGLVTGSRRHHYHHRHGRHYYQKFFFSFDRLFGFFQKDDGSLHGDSVRPDPYIPPSWK